MKTLLWLDDVRNPHEDGWLVFSPITPDKVVWAKSYYEFKDYIIENGLPDAICFDHDLGDEGEKTGHDCAKYLVWWCQEHRLPVPPYNIQSANPVGKANIDGLLKSYIKHSKHESNN